MRRSKDFIQSHLLPCLLLIGSLVVIGSPAVADSSPKPLLHVGDTVESALIALNSRGYHIIYSSALVLPTMTLRTTPKSSDIKELLQEILSPWQLRAVRTQSGDWLVVGNDSSDLKKTSEIPAQTPSASVEEPLDTIIVTGSRYGFAMDGSSKDFLDRQDVEHMPHLGDDAMRMLKVLPGVSGGDFSAALNVRGGRRDETMVTIDGAEIHNATHFRDLDGTFSVLDTNLVQSINFISGGATADYGDYMSGVVDMRTRRSRSDDEYKNTAGISFVSAYGSRGSTFADGKGSWLISARRGFLDILANMAESNGDQLIPRYTDIFASMNFDFTEDTSIATHLLFSDDNLKYLTTDPTDTADSAGRGHSLHGWVTIDHAWSASLHTRSVLAAASLNLTRNSQGSDDKRIGSVHANNNFTFIDFHQDWSWNGTDKYLPRWGFNINQQQANYDYSLQEQITARIFTRVPIDIAYRTQLTARSSKLGAYASLRTRVTDSLTAEAGARWDSYRYPFKTTYDVVSPRLNLVYSIGAKDSIRVAWGVIYQPQGVTELQVEDNVTQFYRPERSRQVTIGYAKSLNHDLSLRFDIYNKDYGDLHPRYENALDSLQLIPEGALDRVRIDAPEARAQGIELTMRRDAVRGLGGWISLALARAEDKDAEQKTWVSRIWEQQTTFSFGGSWTGDKWNINLAGVFHTGTPTTHVGADGVGLRNGERLGNYSRLDLRANRDVHLQKGKLSYYLEVTNLLDSKNECCISNYGFKQDRNGNPYFFQQKTYWLPILPSAGIHFEF